MTTLFQALPHSISPHQINSISKIILVKIKCRCLETNRVITSNPWCQSLPWFPKPLKLRNYFMRSYFTSLVSLINGRKGISTPKDQKCLIRVQETSGQGRTSTSSDKSKVFRPRRVGGRGSANKDGATWAKCFCFLLIYNILKSTEELSSWQENYKVKI